MISRITQTSVNVIRLSFASADNIHLGLNNSWYHAQPHPIILYYLLHFPISIVFKLSFTLFNLVICSSCVSSFLFNTLLTCFLPFSSSLSLFSSFPLFTPFSSLTPVSSISSFSSITSLLAPFSASTSICSLSSFSLFSSSSSDFSSSPLSLPFSFVHLLKEEISSLGISVNSVNYAFWQ